LKIKSVLVALLVFLLLGPIILSANTVDEINQETQQIQQENAELSQNVSAVLEKANVAYQEVEKVKAKLDNVNKAQEKNKKEIEKTQEIIKRRKDLMNNQMRNIQVNQTVGSSLATVFSAESISDLIKRTVALSTIRQAQNEKMEELGRAEEKLKTLVANQDKIANELLQSQASYERESADLNEQVAGLKAKLAENETLLSSLASSKAAEEKRLNDAAKAASQAAAQEEGQAETQPADSSASPTPAPSGEVLQMTSTAYSYSEPGMGYITAIGIDLRNNPNVIAVDPSVIPLGSLVEVSGYGFAIAGDTGGAIRGNIIDVHFPTVDQCHLWGRRGVTVKIH
jgi:3D (Asp-Asp-Asp) domain-containing protein